MKYFGCAAALTVGLMASGWTPSLKAAPKAADKPRLAVLNLRAGEGVPASAAALTSDLMRTAMVKTNLFTIVDRDSIDKVLAEQALQKSGCTDTACAVQVGKLLAADKLMVGTMYKAGSNFVFTANIVDVAKARVDFAEKGTAKGLGGLEEATDDFARRIAARIAGVSESEIAGAPKPRFPVLWRTALLPGWGQWHEGQTTAGAVYFGLAVVAGGVHLANTSKLASARSEYKGAVGLPGFLLGRDTVLLNYVLLSSARSNYESAQSSASASFNALAGIWAFALIDAFFPQRSISGFFLGWGPEPETGRGHLAQLHFTWRF